MGLRVLQLFAVAACCLASGQAVAQQNVVVVLDDSGSMRERLGSSSIKMPAAKNALLEVLANLPGDAEVGVLALNTKVNKQKWIVPLGPVDRQLYEPRIKAVSAKGSTPLGVAIKTGADELLAKRKKNIYGTYRLLIVTDGEAGDQHLVEKYLPDVKARGIVLDVIGVGMKKKHSLATKVHTYRRADDADSLKQAVAEVFAETSGTGDTAEADFELISGLPDELAMSVLTAIAHNENEPIGSLPPSSAASDAHSSPGTQGTQLSPTANPAPTARPTPAPRVQPQGIANALASGFCCLGFLVLMGIAAAVMFNTVRKA